MVVSKRNEVQIKIFYYFSDQQAREALKKIPVFPTSTLRDHPSIQYCEDEVIKRYYDFSGMTRGQAMIRYDVYDVLFMVNDVM